MNNAIKSGTPVITSAPSAGGGVKAAARAEQEKQLRKAYADFEAVFTYYLFKSMRDTVPASGLTDRFPGRETYNMMMDQKIAEELSRRGNGLGLKEMLYRQLSEKVLKDGGNTAGPETEQDTPGVLSPGH